MSPFRTVIFFLIANSTSAVAQSSYPVIDKSVQQARDQERHLILSTELLAEYQALEATNSSIAARPTDELRAKAHRHNENIKALRREIRGTDAAPAPDAPVRAVIKPRRRDESPVARGANSIATYWNPYNRATEARQTIDSSTTLRRDAP